MNPRGQTALEYLITTSFLLVVTGIIFSYALFIYTDSIASSTAKSEVNTIINGVDQVYALGPGNSLFVDVETPKNVFDVTTETKMPNTALVVWLQTSGGLNQISDISRAPFGFVDPTQSMIKNEGRYRLKISWPGSPGMAANTIEICAADGTGACIQP